MRVLTTNDFLASFFPQPTSYGQLPGAAALQATADDLITQAGRALWIDTGDFAQGSALGALSDGAWRGHGRALALQRRRCERSPGP